MTDLENERHRGARANAIMTDPLMIESFAMLKNTYFDAWANSVPTDTATREHCWTMYNAIKELEGQLDSVIKTGKFADRQLTKGV